MGIYLALYLVLYLALYDYCHTYNVASPASDTYIWFHSKN